jgi:hypothetical protein
MPPLTPGGECTPRQYFHQEVPLARPTEESMISDRVINREEDPIALMEKFFKITEEQVTKKTTWRTGPQNLTSNQDGMPAPTRQKASATILVCHLSHQEEQEASSNVYYYHLSKKLTMLLFR